MAPGTNLHGTLRLSLGKLFDWKTLFKKRLGFVLAFGIQTRPNQNACLITPKYQNFFDG